MMLRQIPMLAVVSLVLFLTSGCAAAQSADDPDPRAERQARSAQRAEQRPQRPRQKQRARWSTEQETTPLLDVIDVVSRNTAARFLLDYRVPARVVVGPAGDSEMDYETFLTVLDNNGLAAVRTGEHVTVMPRAEVRTAQTPVVPVGSTAPAGAWVTRVFFVEHLPAAQLVPILRPLMPSAGHLSAQGNSNALLVVDRFANTERLREVIEALDVPARPD